jgi:GNAT superfamily N-acetyltransferase
LQFNEISKDTTKPGAQYLLNARAFFSKGLEDKTYICVVAEQDSKIVSVGGVCVYQTPPTINSDLNEVGFLTNFYTLPEFRKQGYAKEVLNKLLEHCKERKMIRLHMGATEMAYQLYQSAGFIEPGFKQFAMHL